MLTRIDHAAAVLDSRVPVEAADRGEDLTAVVALALRHLVVVLDVGAEAAVEG